MTIIETTTIYCTCVCVHVSSTRCTDLRSIFSSQSLYSILCHLIAKTKKTLMTTFLVNVPSIPCRIWLVSHSTSAASAASRFADINSADMSIWVSYLWFGRWLSAWRTDQLPTDSTGYAEKCANTVRSVLKHTTVSLLSFVCVESAHTFANLASFLAGGYKGTVWLSWSQMLWRTTQAWQSCESEKVGRVWKSDSVRSFILHFSGRIFAQSIHAFQTSMNPFTLTML